MKFRWIDKIVCCLFGATVPCEGWAQSVTVVESPLGKQVQMACAQGDRLYALLDSRLKEGGVYKFDWDSRTWSKVGSKAEQIVIDGKGALYARTRDRVIRYSGAGASWSTIGGPSSSLYAGGARLFSVAPATGDIYQFSGRSDDWSKAGNAAHHFAVDRNGKLYGLGSAGLWVYSGREEEWDQITPDGGSGLFGGGRDKVYTMSPRKAIWAYTPSTREWEQWFPDGERVVAAAASGDGIVAIDIRDDSDTTETRVILAPMTAKKVDCHGILGATVDAIMAATTVDGKPHIAFIKF